MLNNVRLIDSEVPVNITIQGDIITGLINRSPTKKEKLELNFEGALVFPGLINSHDHLDFNLFPQLGDKKYNNYTEWGKYIHQHYKREIAEVLKVPVGLREEWGILKNLLCGVTTVVNHGEKIKIRNPLINVHEKYYCLHSAGFENNWRLKLNHPSKWQFPFVIHTGEGTDDYAGREIDRLIRWNLLRRKLIGVHGVAMQQKQAKNFKALVWCPQSNDFLLGKTATVNELKDYTTILFGTDSTLTGSWNIWEHIRQARRSGLLSDTELYKSLTISAAGIWNTNNGEIAEGKKVDLVVVKPQKGKHNADGFFSAGPADILLVISNGQIKLFDKILYYQLAKMDTSVFRPVNIDGVCKYVAGNLPKLVKDIKQYYSGASFPVTTD